jgi:DNA repair protein RecN (Recombination protein N)
MLRFLSIQNLAVIEAAEVEFQPGLNVLTGETGAGKSILVEAVGLLAGGRAAADLVRTGADACLVQAIFEDASGRELILRREVSARGKSRGFIDGVLVTSGALRETASTLVELHGQHEHQVLLDPAAHLDLVDRFGEHASLRQSVSLAFREFQAARADLERAHMSDRERAARIELLAFQVKEIERVNPRRMEDEEVALQRKVLANAERLHRLCAEAYAALYERDQAALAELSTVSRRLSELAALDPSFLPYEDALPPIKSQLEDLAFFLRSYGASLDASPERLQEVEDRLAALERLKRKYGPALQDVLDRHAAAAEELAQLENAGVHAADLNARYEATRDAYRTAARELSAARRAAAARLTAAIERLLAGLAMERARCEMRFQDEAPEAEWGEGGFDRGEFYISPNPGEELRPLVRVASGGELSRIMLAVRTIASEEGPGKTLIFDEVDAGIGGGVADVVGSRLRQLAERGQVLCITHLPQIASYGTTHFRIVKSVRRGRTHTAVDRLTDRERVDELSRMMGGRVVSDRMRAGAADLLNRRRSPGPQEPPGSQADRGPSQGIDSADMISAQAKGETMAIGESESPGPAKGEAPAARANPKGQSRG